MKVLIIPDVHLKPEIFDWAIDDVLFSLAGLTKEFVEFYMNELRDDVNAMIKAVNCFGDDVLWDETSPIWARSQDGYRIGNVYPPDLMQVVGHTPMRRIEQEGNLLTTDVFSTWSDGRSYGEERLCWVDTVTRKWGYCNG
ncbi:MAG: hypothetical protein IJ757_06450 [Clostridiales bacterium]|nr:hypothetical protein [Clostridiales bacterium]